MSEIFFISDLHFGHKNALSFDNRPFSTIEEHDQKLIENWNNKISSDDKVYILGDVSWYDGKTTCGILKQLHGHKYLIQGNHDDRILKNFDCCLQFREIKPYTELILSGPKRLILCHYPIPCFRNHYYGSYHLYGHVHSGFEHNMMEHVKYDMKALYDKPCNMYNVGCMMPYMDYTPRILQEIAGEDAPQIVG